jgi:hypothetical protein
MSLEVHIDIQVDADWRLVTQRRLKRVSENGLRGCLIESHPQWTSYPYVGRMTVVVHSQADSDKSGERRLPGLI